MGIVDAVRGAKNRVARGVAIRAAARTTPDGVTLTVLGDSFVSGQPWVEVAETFPHKLAKRMGWTVRFVDGQGGTGYVACPPGSNAAYAKRVKHLAKVPSDLVLISGGYNDIWNVVTGKRSLFEVQFAVDATLNAASRMGQRVIVVGPFWTRREASPPEASVVNDYLRDAAIRRGFQFIDVLTDNWVTAENRADIISDDNTHPTSAGHDYIAERLTPLVSARPG